jgi:protein KRI1
MEPPSKKPRRMLLDGSSSEVDSEEDRGGVMLGNRDSWIPAPSFKINEEYARRFEHNKKREELQRCTFQFCSQLMPFIPVAAMFI